MPPTTRARAGRAATASQPTAEVDATRRNPSGPSLAIWTLSGDSLGIASSSWPANTSARQVLVETTRQATNPLSDPNQMIWTPSVPSPKASLDPNTLKQVSALQQLHPWAPVKLCQAMLVGCRTFEGANDALRKYAIEVPDDEDNDKQVKAGSSSQKAPANKTSIQSISNNSIGDGFEYPPSTFSSFSGATSTAKTPTSSTTTSSSRKPGRKSQVEVKIEPGQQLLSFSHPVQVSPGVFSRKEHQHAIASSTETSLDRERAEFIADAVLYKAFSSHEMGYRGLPKVYYPSYQMRPFGMSSGLFPKSKEQGLPPKHLFKGTDRGKFQPLCFNTPDGKVTLQSINLAFPYLKVSLEELRFGDWIRGRRKAPHLFDLFRKLPPEIRCMIWRCAMPPRIIELRYDYDLTKCWTLAKVPITLHVCRESRYEALKNYTLAFGISDTPDKTYFDFRRDTLFLTYEKWDDEGVEYEDQVFRLTYEFVQSEEVKRIRSLAIDQDLLDILAARLEEEEEEWYDIDDEDMPEPELDVIPEYGFLESLAIVKSTIDGSWLPKSIGCDCMDPGCELKKRMESNNKAEFVPVHPSRVANKIKQEFYTQLLAKVKLQNPNWSMPELSYMVKCVPKLHSTTGPGYLRGDWYDG